MQPIQQIPQNSRTTLNAYLDLFNNLEEGLAQGVLQRLTSTNIQFIDPFNNVQGHTPVANVLLHFVAHVQNPRFTILHSAWTDNICFVRWHFHGQLHRGGEWSFPGMSELHFNQQGLIQLHQDHWDSGHYFYQRLPIIGLLIRWIKRKIQLHS